MARATGSVPGVLVVVQRIEFAVGADGVLHDGVVVMIGDVEVEPVGGGDFIDGIAAAGGVRGVGDLVKGAGLGIDLVGVDLAGILEVAGDVEEVDGIAGAAGEDEQRQCCHGRGGQEPLAEVLQLPVPKSCAHQSVLEL